MNLAPDVILPQRFDRARLPANYVFNYQGIARLKPGSTIVQANVDVARMLPIWARRNGPDAETFLKSEEMAPALTPLKRDVVGDVDKLLWVLMGTVGLVLLMACANVANLLVVRMTARQQELGLRAALGAAWGRIAAQLLTESLVLALSGGIFGLMMAYAGVRFLLFMRPANLPRLTDISIDLNVLAFSLAASLLAGLLFGILPIMKYVAPRAIPLRANRTATQGRDRRRAQNSLVVLQVALALVLLVGAGLMIRSFQALRNVQPGFSGPEQIQLLHIAIPANQVPEPERVIHLQNEILGKFSSIRGVMSAAFATEMPMETGFQASNLISIEDKPSDGSSLLPSGAANMLHRDCSKPREPRL